MALDRLFFENRPNTTLPGLQRNVYEYTQRVKDFLRQAHLFSKILSRVTIASSETAVEHGLGYVPVGWRVLSPEAPCTIYQTRAPDTKFLYLANGQSQAGEDWATAERRRLISLAGLDEARAGVTWDGFHAPGKSSATADFGERWDVTVGAGAAIGHQTAGGTTWRNGVCVIEQNSGAWNVNQLLWKGPGLIHDSTTDVGGVAYRFKQHVRPAANAFNAMEMGLLNSAGTKLLGFGYDESVNATYCFLNLGATQVLTTVTIAALSTAEHTVELVRKPSASGQRLIIAYYDGDEVARSTTDGTYTDMKPWVYTNKGTMVFDDMMVVADAAFSGTGGALGDGSVVVSLEVL